MTDIRQMLIDANPVAATEVPDALRAELFAEVRRTPPPKRRELKPWRWPLPTIFVALVAAGGVATATGLLISQETKDQSAALTSAPAVAGDAGGPADYGAQVQAVADAVLATTPSPPGMPDEMDWSAYSGPSAATAEGKGTIQQLIEFRAACRWRQYWVDSKQAGDDAAAGEAATILHQVVDWPTVRGAGEGAENRLIAQRAAQAAEDGDVAAMQSFLESDCRGSP